MFLGWGERIYEVIEENYLLNEWVEEGEGRRR